MTPVSSPAERIRFYLAPLIACLTDEQCQNYVDSYEAGKVGPYVDPFWCVAASMYQPAKASPRIAFNLVLSPGQCLRQIETAYGNACDLAELPYIQDHAAEAIFREEVYDLCLETLGERRPVWYQKPWVAKVILMVALGAGLHLGMRFVELFLNGWAVVFAMFPVGFALGYNSSRIERWIKRKLGTRDRR